MRKTFKYRLFLTKKQETALTAQLEECRWLYNQLLEQRRTTYTASGLSIGLYEQHKSITTLKASRPSLKLVHAQVLQNVAVRVDVAFKSFFRRVKTGDNPGLPRFRGKFRYDSMTFPQCPSGCLLTDDRLQLSKIGSVRVVLHRPVGGTPKTCTVQRSATGKWYVTFSCDMPEPQQLTASPHQVGIDVGLTTFATLSVGDHGEAINNPRFFQTDQAALAKASRKLAKAEKGTIERSKRRKVVARVHERIKFRRDNFVNQTTKRIVDRFGFIAVEDLQVNRMVKTKHLSKSIYDAAWSMFFVTLFVKAANAGRIAVKVNPAYTSQTCSGCGHRQRLTLSDRTYKCSECGLERGRDHNASLNILALGLQSIRGNSVEVALFR